MQVDKSVAASLIILVVVYIVTLILGEHDDAWFFVVNIAFAAGAAAWVWKDAKRIELARYQVWLTNSNLSAALLTFFFPYVYLPCYAANRAVILSGHGELKPETTTAQSPVHGPADPLERLEKLAALKEKGLLTKEEYQTRKKQLLEE